MVPRATSAEEVKPSAVAVNGNGAGKAAALDFDELTELIKWVPMQSGVGIWGVL